MRRSMLAIAGCLGMVMGGAVAGESTPLVQGSKASTDEVCRNTLCQHDVRVVLKGRDGAVFDRTFDVLPGVVQPRWLTIVAGQSLHIEADRLDDSLTNFRVVDAVAHPEKTLDLTLAQSDDGNMLLTLHNPFGQALKFDMGMMPLTSERVLKTSSCPVIAGGTGFETWPYPIFQIVLANPRFIDPDKGNVRCD